MRKTFEQDLQEAIEYHGHLCAGQILGTRIARLGMAHFGVEDAQESNNLIAFVEADRCIADAVSSVANCHIGRRRLKWHDLGKMAAVFYDVDSKKAIRICAINESRPPEGTHGSDLINFYQAIPDSEMFKIQNVDVEINEFDLPGKPLRRVVCEECGENVMDGREVIVKGGDQGKDKTLCKFCAGIDTYYKVIS